MRLPKQQPGPNKRDRNTSDGVSCHFHQPTSLKERPSREKNPENLSRLVTGTRLHLKGRCRSGEGPAPPTPPQTPRLTRFLLKAPDSCVSRCQSFRPVCVRDEHLLRAVREPM
ncbi:hypothetical protein E1301_Tti006155 [Triplophysa tibetana]|uniref:Uncharacterized protein n=1 Tax=Triplophysa tibetana TaxID=1572043 RepID=A0A5A9NRK9_9TELE|nr:hypothetical protein E1301_Tti006155 [Triplophysa tibetana]